MQESGVDGFPFWLQASSKEASKNLQYTNFLSLSNK